MMNRFGPTCGKHAAEERSKNHINLLRYVISCDYLMT
jgi:hypothetical protein